MTDSTIWIWSFVFKALAMVILRFKDKSLLRGRMSGQGETRGVCPARRRLSDASMPEADKILLGESGRSGPLDLRSGSA
jgi:hypothetical protein